MYLHKLAVGAGLHSFGFGGVLTVAPLQFVDSPSECVFDCVHPGWGKGPSAKGGYYISLWCGGKDSAFGLAQRFARQQKKKFTQSGAWVCQQLFAMLCDCILPVCHCCVSPMLSSVHVTPNVVSSVELTVQNRRPVARGPLPSPPQEAR